MTYPNVFNATQIDSTPQYELGTKALWVVVSSGVGVPRGIVQYVQFLDAVTYVGLYSTAGAATVGMACTWADTGCTTVTNDRSGGSSLGQVAAGVPCGVPTQNSYGWMLVRGPALVGPTDGSVALAEMVVPHASTDGGLDTWSSTLQPLGYALADDSSTTSVLMMLTIG